MSMDNFDKDFFKALLCTACDSKNVNKSKNVGTAMAMIFGANKIKSRYPKIVRFLGKIECDTSILEKQFTMYNKLYEYLMNKVPSTDVSYWKQLLTENKYKEPAENNDLWSNIFGEDVVNIKGIYISEDSNILKQEEKQLSREESNEIDNLDESDTEAFDTDFFENEFFSDDEDQKCNEIKADSKVKELDHYPKKNFDLGNEKKKDPVNLQTHTEKYQGDILHESDKISVRMTSGGVEVENHLNKDMDRSKSQGTTAATARGPQHLSDQGMKKKDHLSSVDKALRCGTVSIYMEGKITFYKCNVCNLSTSGLKPMKFHLQGVKHMNVLRMTDGGAQVENHLNKDLHRSKSQGNTAATDVVQADLNHEKKVATEDRNAAQKMSYPLNILIKQEKCLLQCRSGKIQCLWCSVMLNNENEVKQHLAGLNHRKNIPSNNATAGLQMSRSGGINCLWCKVMDMSKIGAQQHLAGSRHRKNTPARFRHGNNTPGNNIARAPVAGAAFPGAATAVSTATTTSTTSEGIWKSIPVLSGRIAENKELKKISGANHSITSFKNMTDRTWSSEQIYHKGPPLSTSISSFSSTTGQPSISVTSFGIPPPGIPPPGIPPPGIPPPGIPPPGIPPPGILSPAIPPPRFAVQGELPLGTCPSPVASTYTPHPVPPPASVSSIPIPCAPNLSIPPPSYHIPPPSSVVSTYIPRPVTSSTPVFSIPFPCTSDVYIPRPSFHIPPPYISSPVLPSNPESQIPIACASDAYIPRPSHHTLPPYIPTPVPPPTSVSSTPISCTSNVSIPSPSYHIPPPSVPDLSAPPPMRLNITGSYLLTSVPPISLHDTELGSATTQQPSKTEKLDMNQYYQDAENVAEINEDMENFSENIRFDIRSPDEKESKSKIRNKRQSRSRSPEKVRRKYDSRSPERRHRKSKSRSPERKHRKHKITNDRRHRKSESMSPDRTQGKRLRSKSTDRQGKSSSSRSKSKKRRSKGRVIEVDYLMSVCDKIGILGHSLRAALEKTQKFRNDSRKIIESLSDPESQELLLLIARRLKNLIEETKDIVLLSIFTHASIATNLLLESTKSYLEASNLDPESTESIEHEFRSSNDISGIGSSAYNDISGIGSSAYNRIEVCDKRSIIEGYSRNYRSSSTSEGSSNIDIKSSTPSSSQTKYSDDLTPEEKKLIQRISEGRIDNIRGCEKEYASKSEFHAPSAISEMFSGHVNSTEIDTKLQYENLSTIQNRPQQFTSGVFKVAIFGHDYVDRLPVSSGRIFQSKTPGISYQVMKYASHGAEINKIQDYSIWTEVISAQPNMIFLILGKNDVSASISPRDVGNGMVQIKMQLERRIPNVQIVCFGLETHDSDYHWRRFQEELNSFLETQFSMFIYPSPNIDIGSESYEYEATMSVWFHMQEYIEHVEHQQIMLNTFLST